MDDPGGGEHSQHHAREEQQDKNLQCLSQLLPDIGEQLWAYKEVLTPMLQNQPPEDLRQAIVATLWAIEYMHERVEMLEGHNRECIALEESNRQKELHLDQRLQHLDRQGTSIFALDEMLMVRLQSRNGRWCRSQSEESVQAVRK